MMGPSSYSAQALTGVTVCALPREGFDAMFQRISELAVRFSCIATKSMESAFATQAIVGRGTARERTANLLADLDTRSHLVQTEANEALLAPPITQEHIGDALGLTSAHVSRTLKQLREDDIVSLRGHALHIFDRAALLDVAVIAQPSSIQSQS